MARKRKLPTVEDPYLEVNLVKAIKRTKNGKVKNEAILGNVKEKAGSMTRQADGKNNEAKHFVKIDLVSKKGMAGRIWTTITTLKCIW
jgi:hypothetical protein